MGEVAAGLLTHSIHQSPSWEADRFSASLFAKQLLLFTEIIPTDRRVGLHLVLKAGITYTYHYALKR
jgi:hypothetical protein